MMCFFKRFFWLLFWFCFTDVGWAAKEWIQRDSSPARNMKGELCHGQWERNHAFVKNHLIDISLEKKLINLGDYLTGERNIPNRQRYLEDFLLNDFLVSEHATKWLLWQQHFVHPVQYIRSLLTSQDTDFLKKKDSVFQLALEDLYRQFQKKYKDFLKAERLPMQWQIQEFLDGLEFFISWFEILEMEEKKDLTILYQYFAKQEQDPLPYRNFIFSSQHPLEKRHLTVEQCYFLGSNIGMLNFSPDNQALGFSLGGLMRFVFFKDNQWDYPQYASAHFYPSKDFVFSSDSQFAFSTGSNWLILYERDGFNFQYHTNKTQVKKYFFGVPTIHPTGNYLAFISSPGDLNIHRFNQDHLSLYPLDLDQGKNGKFYSNPVFSSDGKYLAVGTNSGELLVYALRDDTKWELDQTFSTQGTFNSAPTFSQDHQYLAFGSDDHKLYILKHENSYPKKKWTVDQTIAMGSALRKAPQFSDDSQFLAIQNNSNQISVFQKKASDWDLIQTIEIPHTLLTEPRFSRDSQSLVFGSDQGSLYFYTWQDEKFVLNHTYQTEAPVNYPVTFSPNGQYMAAGTEEGSIFIFK